MNPKATILIVDDDQGIRDSLSDILEMEGYGVAVAHDGVEGVKRCREETYDAVLMDIRMPNMDGVEALERIRQLDPQSIVIMITAFSRDERVDRAREVGALDVLFKPIDLDRLLGLLSAVSEDPVVVVVDDDPEFGESLKDALQLHGYRPLLAQDGAEAAQLAQETGCEAVLLDLRLQGPQGVEVLRSLREQGVEAAVLIVTGYAQELEGPIAEALDLHARAVVEKPLDMSRVFSFLEEAHRSRLASLVGANAA